MAVEMEYKGEVVLVNPITSIVSIQHLRRLRYEYHIASSKRYDFPEPGENEKQKVGKLTIDEGVENETK